MEIKQQSHLKMLITTRDVLDSFKTLWSDIVAFVTARADFGAAIASIQQQELKQTATTGGGTLDKHAARVAMCNAAAIVGGAVAAYADKQGDNELFAKVDFSAPDLQHQTEQDCAANCQAILDAATANITALTAAKSAAQSDLDDLEKKIDAFNTALTRPRQIRTNIKGATDQIPVLITAADRIAERQLDRLMERFKATNPDFYSAYRVARVIVDAGGRPGTTTPPTPPPTPAAQ
jgi:hypothetical protein